MVLSWWVYKFISSWVCELMNLWFCGWWACKLISRYIRWLGLGEFISQWVDLSYTSYMRGVFYNVTPSLWRKMRQETCAIDIQSSTCRECIEWLPPGRFLRHTHVLPQTNAAEFQILLYLCPVLRTWEECLTWFSGTKIINSSQFIEIL